MKPIVLITGANSLVGKAISNLLSNKYEVRFLSRTPNAPNVFKWNVNSETIFESAFEGVNHIIHLAGSSIAEGRWTAKRKADIVRSRVASAKLILNTLKRRGQVLDSFICASAIGFYGAKTDNIVYNETMSSGSDFLANVCKDWEAAAQEFKTKGIAKRINILRLGIVLSNNGGALPKMITPIKYGLGTIFGSGEQFLPWIHINDVANMVNFVLNNKDVDGIFNAVAPNCVNSLEFTTILANCLNRKLYLPTIPSTIVRLFFGESACLLLEGVQVSCKKIQDKGFCFKYDNINKALANLVNT